MTTLNTFIERWFDYLEVPEERSRALFLVIANVLLMVATILVLIINPLEPHQFGSVALNFALAISIISLILLKKYPFAVVVFVTMRPLLTFLMIPVRDLSTVLYIVPWFVAVALFLKRRITVMLYGIGITLATFGSALLTQNNPRYAFTEYTDVFLFAIMSVVVITLAALVINRDMAQMREQAYTLQDSEERMRALLDNFPGVILVYDRQFCAREFYAAPLLAPPALKMPVLGTFIREHCTADQRPVMQQQLERVFASGQPTTFELIGWEPHRWYDVTASPLLEHGTIKRVIVVFLEISRRKRAEAAQRAAVRDLQDFAYIISHDLRAPLRGINTVAQWLEEDYAPKIDDKGREFLDMLHTRVRLMDSMINGVFEYSRIGRQEIIQPVNLNDVIKEITAAIVPPERACVIVETPLPTINIDPTRIRQVLQNLIDNAVKYGDKPMTEIRVSAVRLLNGWSFTIADNGRGIPEAHFERIFQIFQALSPTSRESSTGIGLTITKKIVDYYGGTLQLSSEVGKGTTFIITLPTIDSEVASGKDTDHPNE